MKRTYKGIPARRWRMEDFPSFCFPRDFGTLQWCEGELTLLSSYSDDRFWNLVVTLAHLIPIKRVKVIQPILLRTVEFFFPFPNCSLEQGLAFKRWIEITKQEILEAIAPEEIRGHRELIILDPFWNSVLIAETFPVWMEKFRDDTTFPFGFLCKDNTIRYAYL
jgi:hypothetical protein